MLGDKFSEKAIGFLPIGHGFIQPSPTFAKIEELKSSNMTNGSHHHNNMASADGKSTSDQQPNHHVKNDFKQDEDDDDDDNADGKKKKAAQAKKAAGSSKGSPTRRGMGATTSGGGKKEEEEEEEEEDLLDIKFLNVGDIRLDDRTFFLPISASLRPYDNAIPQLHLGIFGDRIGPHTAADNVFLSNVLNQFLNVAGDKKKGNNNNNGGGGKGQGQGRGANNAGGGGKGRNGKGENNGRSGFESYQRAQNKAVKSKDTYNIEANRNVDGQARASSGARRAVNTALFHYNKALAVYTPRFGCDVFCCGVVLYIFISLSLLQDIFFSI
jgi:hypothetical protein